MLRVGGKVVDGVAGVHGRGVDGRESGEDLMFGLEGRPAAIIGLAVLDQELEHIGGGLEGRVFEVLETLAEDGLDQPSGGCSSAGVASLLGDAIFLLLHIRYMPADGFHFGEKPGDEGLHQRVVSPELRGPAEGVLGIVRHGVDLGSRG